MVKLNGFYSDDNVSIEKTKCVNKNVKSGEFQSKQETEQTTIQHCKGTANYCYAVLRWKYTLTALVITKKANEIIVKAFRKLSPSTLYNRNDHNAVNSRES